MEFPKKNTAAYTAAYEKMKRWYRALPEKKRYLEFVTAFLTIPVLLTVLLNNISNIKRQESVTPTPSPVIISVTPAASQGLTSPVPTAHVTEPPTSPTPTSTLPKQCKSEVGPVDIVYPENGDILTDNPVCLDITRESSQYCSVVWSYRINGSAWSNYTDRTICMYGLDPGEKKLELRVKSIVSGDEIILKRTFTIAGNPSPTPASSSAQMP